MKLGGTVYTKTIVLTSLALAVAGLLIVRPVLAQEEASSPPPSENPVSSEPTPSEPSPHLDIATSEPISSGSSTASTDTSSESSSNSSASTDTPAVATSDSSQAPATTTETAQTNASTSGLVEVQLQCSKSYVGTLYDTPSGHLDVGYFVGTESASTTGMIVAHEVGQQAWTVCHDARGHGHEFTLTAEEYAALAENGMPSKSIMEPADQAALDSF
jgi:cytoskeletal protein RodZ